MSLRTKCLFFVGVCLPLAHTLLFATPSLNAGGYYGYNYAPTARAAMDTNWVAYSLRLGIKNETKVRQAIMLRPLQILELGVGISRSPIPALKFTLPSNTEDTPKLAFGFSGKRIYFSGGIPFKDSLSTFYLDVAGIYDIDLHAPVGVIAGEADLTYSTLSVENYFFQNQYGVSTQFTIKPLTAFNLPSYFEIGAGLAWRSPEHPKDVSIFALTEVKAPLPDYSKNKDGKYDPVIFVDINPAFDHSVTFARNQYPTRIALDLDAVLAMPFSFYVIGGLSPSLKINDQDRLPDRDIFDRCYLMWNSDKFPFWLAGGMLNTDIWGGMGEIYKNTYNKKFPLSLTLGYTLGDQKGFTAIGEVPLHPHFSGGLSKSTLFAEGGYFLGEKLAAQLNFRQGDSKKFLQIGSGYDFEQKSIFGELSFQYSFSLTKNIYGMEFRLAPNLQHRENSPFYIFKYEVPIYQEGNNERRLHNFPWVK